LNKKLRNMKFFVLNKAYAMIVGLLFTLIACAQTTEYAQKKDLSDYDEYDVETLSHYLETNYNRHEISLWGAWGVSTLQYRPVFGISVKGNGGAFGIGYTHYLSKKWGLSSGLEYAFYQSKNSFNAIPEDYETLDILNNPINYCTSIENYSENLFTSALNIPVSVLFQTGGNQKFYALVGVKLGLPLISRYMGSNSVLTASGYYPDYDQTEVWQNDLGYGIFNLNGKKGKLDLDVSVMGTFETGMKWRTGIGSDLFTGVFVDYGFNSLLNSSYSKKLLVEYNRIEPSQPLMNTACVLVDRISSLAFGLKIKFAFSFGCRDLLIARKAYKKLKVAVKQDDGGDEDEFFDFSKSFIQQKDTIEITPPVTPVDTLNYEFSEEQQHIDSTEIIEERQAYLEAVNERRKTFNHSMNVPDYNRGIVTLTDEQKSALDGYIDLMNENQTLSLDITGHCCDLGTDELNMLIGQERADLAKDYLVERGILPSRIHTFSKGKTEPLFPNDSEENRRKNRRLEIIIKE